MLNDSESGVHTLEDTVLFCRALREHGLAVTPSESMDAARAFSLIDRDDRREVFLSLRSILTSRVEDFPVFEELFDLFWSRSGETPPPRKVVETPGGPTKEGRGRRSSSTQTPKGLPYLLENWLPAEQAGS